MNSEEKNTPFLKLDPHLRKISLFIGYMLILAGVIVAMKLSWPVIAGIFNVLLPFLVALIAAYIFNPIVNFVQQRLKLTRVGGVVVVNLLILGAAAGFIAIIIPILTGQVQNAYHGIRGTVQEKVVPWASEAILNEPGFEHIATLDDLHSYVKSNQENLPETVQRSDVEEFLHGWEELTDSKPKRVKDLSAYVLSYYDEDETPKAESPVGPNPFENNTPESLEAIIVDAKVRTSEKGRVTWEKFEERISTVLQGYGIETSELLENAVGNSQLRSAAQTAASGSAGIFGQVIGFIIGIITTLISSTVFIIFVIIISFYLLLDFDSLKGVIEVLTPDEHEDRLFSILGKTDVAVGGFIRGQIISASLVGLMAFIGLSILGLKQYALLIGFIAGFGNLIPYLGPILGAAPAVLYMLFSDAYDGTQEKLMYAGLVVGLFVIIQTIEGFVFQPKIVGKSAQLHPIAVIIALAFGAQFGIMGMIVAVPVACIIRVLFKEFFWDEREKEWNRTTGKTKLDDPDRGSLIKKKQKTQKA